MDDAQWPQKRSRAHARLLQQLDSMVESGQVTRDEAAQLRRANDAAGFETALQGIRLRHAETRLSTAIAAGEMSREEADAVLLRLANGEHPRSLRAHLRVRHTRSSSNENNQ